MKSYTEYVIEKDRVTATMLIFFLIGGLFAYFSMPRAKDPSLSICTAVISTVFAGATPSRIESLVTIPIERQLKQINEIKVINSTSKNGVSIIYVDIKDQYDDLDPIWDKIRKKIQTTDLPQEVGEPQIDDSFTQVYGTLINIIGEGFSYSELEKIANDVKKELLSIPDSGSVEIIGLQK